MKQIKFALIFATLSLAPSAFSQALEQSIPFSNQLAQAALERTEHDVTYDPSYFSISYPMGDVPEDRGVCTDVVVRAYRALGIDLQELVHVDMKANFSAYPKIWGLSGTDSNIDHRRVPNLRRYFERQGAELAVTDNPDDYQAGDIVSWNLVTDGTLAHIGIVSENEASDGTPLIVHNIGAGPRETNILFGYEITGHYRFNPN